MKKTILIVILAMMILAIGVSAWVGDYPTRKPIDCSAVTTGAPAVIGGGTGFLLGGDQQLVWTRCQPGLFLYYDELDNTDYVVGTDSAQVAFEVDEGTGTSYNPTEVWTGYLIVNHMKQFNSTHLLDSSPTGNDLLQGYTYPTSAVTSDYYDGLSSAQFDYATCVAHIDESMCYEIVAPHTDPVMCAIEGPEWWCNFISEYGLSDCVTYPTLCQTTEADLFGIGTGQRLYSADWGDNTESYLETELPIPLTGSGNAFTFQGYSQSEIGGGYHALATMEGVYPNGEGLFRFWLIHPDFGNYISSTSIVGDFGSNLSVDTAGHLTYYAYDGTNHKVYTNRGTPAIEQVNYLSFTNTDITGTQNLWIGATGNNGQWGWKGTADEIRIFNGIVSETQMNEEFNNFLATDGYGTLGVEEVLEEPEPEEESSSSGSTRYMVDANGNVVGVVVGNQVISTPQPQQGSFLSLTGGQGFDLIGWIKGIWASLFGGK